MGRILYAVQGEGLGHAARAHSVTIGLMERGHDVQFVASYLATDYLRKHFPDRVHDIFGFRLRYKAGQIHVPKSVAFNLREMSRRIVPTLRTVHRAIADFRPDLVITDSEEFAPMVAKRVGVPYISLDNQHLITHCDLVCPPGVAVDHAVAYIAIRMFYFGAQRYLIPTFIQAPIRYHPTTLLPPILRQAIYSGPVTHGDYLVAYLGGSGQSAELRAVLESAKGIPIRAYGFGLTGEHGNVTYKPTSTDAFLADLSGCAGVIATAGHTLVTECLYLDKPMLIVPFTRQFEQQLNAFYVERMGAGRNVAQLSPDVIASFADRLDGYRSAIARYPKAALEPVLDAVERELDRRS